ncbi:MAG: MBL fold metallo-hydrolase [Candidatus Lokiarchaeota archaeon]|nr:MBL fold metallo-hydrolase [Candidatus Lokiarchaeota archaeon]MBD3341410.1 MBL fold metallo-hydrolase [Candidatus Lokiarchaeota archaeon]
MLKTEIIILANNYVLPFQNLEKEYGLECIQLNKLFATQSLAEHGLGFLINIYDLDDLDNQWNPRLIKKIIFDVGGPNLTFIHNLDIRAYQLNDVDNIILSHWHYDHTGGLYKVLERINKPIQVICHTDARYERFFRRSPEVKKEDLQGKTRQEIASLLSSSKLVNQEPIDMDRIKELNGKVFFSKFPYEILDKEGLKIRVSGEIPRKHEIEDFTHYYSLQDGTLKTDQILDDKCLIFEYDNEVILLNGCCHSGLMNTLDYVKKLTDKPVSHIIGGFHMASASEEKIESTMSYLRTFQKFDKPLYLFPIHCSGDRIIQEINRTRFPEMKALNASVGTVFSFTTGFC